MAWPRTMISRPYGPGLIEASGTMAGSGRRRRFPGPMGRASLKPFRFCLVPGGYPAISRPYGPGLIEAAMYGITTRPGRSSISRPYGPGLIEAIRW